MPEEVLDQELEEEIETDDSPLDDVIEPEVAEDGEQDVVMLEGEEPPAVEEEPKEAPKWVKEVRDRNKELKKQLREKEEELSRLKVAPSVQAQDIGPKPTLKDDDVEYDAEKFEKKLLDWTEKKRKADEIVSKVQKEQESAQKAWDSKIATYDKAKRGLRVHDFDDAEDLVKELFSPTQLSVIIDGAKHPEELIYALGKRPELAKKMADIKNLARFTMELGVLETKVQSTRKTAPAPEKVVRTNGSSPLAGGGQLARLEAEAEKTGDRSKIIAYNRQLREREQTKK